MTSPHIAAGLTGYAGLETEARDLRREGYQALALDQIGLPRDAVHKMHRLAIGVSSHQLIEHGKKGGHAGAAGQKQQGTPDPSRGAVLKE